MTNRPLSPHLQIYKPQLTSMLSILHRITGAGLGLGALLVTGWLFAAMSGEHAFSFTRLFRESWIGQLMLLGWVFCFVYHFLNGLRHLKWDLGYGLSLKNVYRSGTVVVIGSLIITYMIWTGVK